MLRTALKDKRGVTLVEVMIALVILLIVFMGLIQTSLLTIDSNATNVLRDEAVRLASDTMISLRSSPFDDLNRDGAADGANFVLSSTGTAAQQLNASRLGINTQKIIRNILNANYVITVTITTMDANNKRADVLVQWDYKERRLANGNPNAHRVVSLLRRV
jgi:prepilin-type N-terminal cleavage/methylation domain-containing protein